MKSSWAEFMRELRQEARRTGTSADLAAFEARFRKKLKKAMARRRRAK